METRAIIDWLIELRLRVPHGHKIGHFGDVLPNQSLGTILKKLNLTKPKAHIQCRELNIAVAATEFLWEGCTIRSGDVTNSRSQRRSDVAAAILSMKVSQSASTEYTVRISDDWSIKSIILKFQHQPSVWDPPTNSASYPQRDGKWVPARARWFSAAGE